jgi:hypothetical protein
MQALHEYEVYRRFSDQPLFPWQSGGKFENLEFRSCQFQNCRISITTDPRRRCRVRNVRLVDCQVTACAVRYAP